MVAKRRTLALAQLLRLALARKPHRVSTPRCGGYQDRTSLAPHEAANPANPKAHRTRRATLTPPAMRSARGGFHVAGHDFDRLLERLGWAELDDLGTRDSVGVCPGGAWYASPVSYTSSLPSANVNLTFPLSR